MNNPRYNNNKYNNNKYNNNKKVPYGRYNNYNNKYRKWKNDDWFEIEYVPVKEEISSEEKNINSVISSEEKNINKIEEKVEKKDKEKKENINKKEETEEEKEENINKKEKINKEEMKLPSIYEKWNWNNSDDDDNKHKDVIKDYTEYKRKRLDRHAYKSELYWELRNRQAEHMGYLDGNKDNIKTPEVKLEYEDTQKQLLNIMA